MSDETPPIAPSDNAGQPPAPAEAQSPVTENLPETPKETVPSLEAALPTRMPITESFVVACRRPEINDDCIHVLKANGIEPIILNDPNEKRALVEMLSEHPAVRFAVVILAGDDFVYDRQIGKPAEALLSAKPNVVFHLGFLLRHLGPLNTLILYKEQKSFRMPTGIQNAAFVPYVKNGTWIEILRSKIREASA